MSSQNLPNSYYTPPQKEIRQMHNTHSACPKQFQLVTALALKMMAYTLARVLASEDVPNLLRSASVSCPAEAEAASSIVASRGNISAGSERLAWTNWELDQGGSSNNYVLDN